MKIGIMYCSLNSGNMGVQALAYSSIQLLSEACQKINRTVEFYFFDGTKPLKDYRIEIDGQLFYTQSFSFNGLRARYLYTGKVLKDELIPAFRRCNLIWDTSGGDSFSDIYGWAQFLFLYLLRIRQIRMGKKVIMAPQTIGPFSRGWVRLLACHSMRRVFRIYSRDSESSDYLKSLLPKIPFKTYIDMAMFLPYVRIEQSPHFVHVGINVSGLLYRGGYTQNNQFGLNTNYIFFVKRVIEFFLEKPGINIHLIPHVLANSSTEDDLCVCEELKKQYPKIALAPPFVNPMEAKSYIAGMDFFIGSRMHSTIAAFSAGVPVFPLAYSRKFKGLFEKTLGYKHLGDMVNERSETIMPRLQQCFNNRLVLREELIQSCALLKEIKHDLVRSIAQDLMMANEGGR